MSPRNGLNSVGREVRAFAVEPADVLRDREVWPGADIRHPCLAPGVTTMFQPKTQWLFYAVASGGCAALNGVFAKLTTTQLTTTWATGISHLFGLSEPSRIVEILIRGVSLQIPTCLVACCGRTDLS